MHEKGVVRHHNKHACERYLNKYCDSAYHIANFALGKSVVACKKFGTSYVRMPNRMVTSLRKVVRFRFYPDVGSLFVESVCLSIRLKL